MKFSNRFNIWMSILALSVILLVAGVIPFASFSKHKKAAHQAVQNAWEQAQAADSFRFTSELEQKTTPAPTLRNTGRSPQSNFLYMEGMVDQTLLEAKIWQNGGSLLQPETAIHVQSENGRFYTKIGDKWQETHSAGFSGENDPLFFFQGMTNFEPLPAGAFGAGYAFDLDGDHLARALRDQMQQALQREGQLPPGMSLQIPTYFEQFEGHGEIWLDEDGLPSRLTIEMTFAPQPGQDRISAVLKTDYSNFENAPVDMLTQIRSSWTANPQLQQGLAASTLLLFAGLGFLRLLWRFRRSPRLYPAVSAVLALFLLLSPLAQIAQAAAYGEALDTLASSGTIAQLSLDEGKEPAHQPAETISDEAAFASWQSANPQPLASDLTDTDGDGLSDALENNIGSDPNVVDTDEDGLNDGIEFSQIGTLPTAADTDGDGLLDDREVNGFLVDGQMVYPDPLNPDTNADGLLDGTECFGQSELADTPAPCSDQDNDGVLDLFDGDNDGDNVPDSSDLAPQQALNAIFNNDNPFRFDVAGLTPDKPVYVDLQLRPVDPNHLTYGLSVLDWPAGDTQGQIQRTADTTFATTPKTEFRQGIDGAANGDMRLIPMLTVRIPKEVGSTGNLPLKDPAFRLQSDTTIEEWIDALDTDLLQAYAITPVKLDDFTLELYLPATLQTDSTGGDRVAFRARTVYWPQLANWGSAHEVRLVWLVQMLTSKCQQAIGVTVCEDDLQIVHRYDDDWRVTGLSVQEQGGLDVAVIEGDPSLAVDESIWKLGFGLMNTFAVGLDENSDGSRDLTVAEITRRWQTGSTASDVDRWQIPADTTDVSRFSYAHADLITQISMVEIKNILAGMPTSSTPNLLIAQEIVTRQAGLSRTVVNGSQATIHFDAAGPIPSALPAETAASVSWATYEYQNGRWVNMPAENAVNDLLLPFLQADPYFQPAADTPTGIDEANLRQQLAISSYLVLYNGYTAVVQAGSTPIDTSNLDGLDIDLGDPLLNRISGIVQTNKDNLTKLFKTFNVLAKLRTSVTGSLKIKAVGASGGGSAALITVGSLLLAEELGADGTRIAQGTAGTLAIGLSAYTKIRYLKAQKAFVFAIDEISEFRVLEKMDDIKSKAKAGVAGTLVSLSLSWGVYALKAGTLEGPAKTRAIVDASAETAVALVLLALSFTPAGAAANLIILFLDGLALIVCAALGVEAGDSGGFLCSGVSGALSWVVFRTNEYVDLNQSDLYTIEDVDLSIRQSDLGLSGGNIIDYRVSTYTGLKPADDWGDDDWDIRRSVIDYRLEAEEQLWRKNMLRPGTMSGQWSANQGNNRYEYRANLVSTKELPEAGGINVYYPTYLTGSLLVLYEECWGVILFCDDEETRLSHSFNLSESTTFDVFPVDLDGFYNLVETTNGAYAQSWGASGRMSFPPLVDGDGDGLRSRFFGGSDLNDGRWDSDADHLNDKFEYEIGTPADDPDRDGDNLSDYEEVILGTNPLLADSDYDGLTDSEELDGWEFVYGVDSSRNPLTTWVRSNPLDADADGDDLLDSKEKLYGFNPNVPSDNLIMSYNGILQPPNTIASGLYATAGDILNYDAEVTNELFNRHFFGQLETTADAGLAINNTLEDFFILPQEGVTRTHDIAVGEVDSGVYRISQAARAQIADPRAATLNSHIFYSFDNDRPFLDLSGNLPSQNALCGEEISCPESTLGRVGQAMTFNGFNDGLVVQNSETFSQTTFSIGGWIRPDRFQSKAQMLFSKQALGGLDVNFSLMLFPGSLRPFISYSEADCLTGQLGFSNAYLSLDDWNHVMLVVDSDEAFIYVNGQPDNPIPIGPRCQNDQPIRLGHDSMDFANRGIVPFDGEMDELAIFDRALTPGEISELMGPLDPAFDLPFEKTTYDSSTNRYSFFDRSGEEVLAWCEVSGSGPAICPVSLGPVNVSDDRTALGLSNTIYVPAAKTPNLRLMTTSLWTKWDIGNPQVVDSPVLDLKITASGRVEAQIPSMAAPLISDSQITDNQWVHLATVYDGANLILYQNGREVGRTPVAAVLGFSYDMVLHGPLDDFQIFRQGLTAEQIQSLYAGGQQEILLPFDDSPAATRFANLAPFGAPGSCLAGSCPDVQIRERVGHVASFTGSDRLDIPINAEALDEITLMAWVKQGSGPQTILEDENGTIIWNTAGFSFNYNLGGSPQALFLTIPPEFRPTADEWHHYAVKVRREWNIGSPDILFNVAIAELFVDGSLVATSRDQLERQLGQLFNPGKFTVNPEGGDMMMDDLRLYRGVVNLDVVRNETAFLSPDLYLQLDEDEGTTTINEQTGRFSPTCTNCPQFGVNGQIASAANFDGSGAIEVTQQGELFIDNTRTTFAAWVKPGPGGGTILAQATPENQRSAYRFYISPDGRLHFGVQPTDETLDITVSSAQPLPTGSWTHVAATLQDVFPYSLTLFVNGEVAAVTNTSQLSIVAGNDAPLLVGAADICSFQACRPFIGRIDEVLVYQGGLDPEAIRVLYDLQTNWIEERSRYELTVDNDAPLTELRSTPVYLANQPTILDIFAADVTSDIDTVELLVSGTASDTAAAPVCEDGAGRTAFCPMFTPAGEGSYTLNSRAVDLLGHTTTSSAVNVLVDAGSPQVTVDLENNALIRLVPSDMAAERWVLSLEGTVTDPALLSGQDGSGVRDMLVTLFYEAGQPAGQGTGAVTINQDGSWSLDYVIDFRPTGVFTLELIARDNVGNESVVQRAVTIDNEGPQIEAAAGSPDQLVGGSTLSGTVSDALENQLESGLQTLEVAYIPAPLGSTAYNPQWPTDLTAYLPFNVPFDTGAALNDLSGQNHHGRCTVCPEVVVDGFRQSGLIFGSSNEAVELPSLTNVIENSLTVGVWVNPADFVDNAAFLTFKNSGGPDLSMGLNRTGQIEVNGSGLVTTATTLESERWAHILLTIDGTDQAQLFINGEPAADWTESVRATGSLILGQSAFVGQLDELHVFDRALLPAEIKTLFQGDEPVLWLSFDAPQQFVGDRWADRSNWGHLTEIIGGPETVNLAQTGIVGDRSLAQAHFVQPTAHPALDLSGGRFTQSAWIFIENQAQQDRSIFGSSSPAVSYPALQITADGRLKYGFGAVSATTPPVIETGRWHFAAATFDGQAYILYVDGVEIQRDLSFTGQRPVANQAPVIGSPEIDRIDEVQIVARPLSGREINALYLQGWQTTGSFSGQEYSDWVMPVRDGLEGLFTVELRATDVLGNDSRAIIWDGLIDTLDPRVTVMAANDANQTADVLLIEDFNLNEATVNEQCFQISTMDFYEAPWYLALRGESLNTDGRVVQITATCEGDIGQICDRLGNCEKPPVWTQYLPVVRG